MSNDITNDDVRELVKLAVDSGVAEIEVQRGNNRVRIRRAAEGHDGITAVAPAPSSVQHLQPAAVPAAPPQAAAPQAPASNDFIVKSPIVGTYYDQPKTDDPPFVRVGDHVEPGQALCIIESMKLMNEIESEIAGTVVAKLMENGRPVEYGEALFAIRPR